METRHAAEIGGQLAQAVQANDEMRWMIRTALQEFPSEPTNIWMSEDEHAVHWLSGNVLGTITAENAAAQINARPVDAGAWLLEVEYESGQLGDVVVYPGLRSSWLFTLPSAEQFEVKGEIIFRGDGPADLDAGEQLARAIAAQLGQRQAA